MREEYTSNSKAKVEAIWYFICDFIVLIAAIYIIAIDGPQLATIVAALVILLIISYLAIDSLMYYKNFKVTLTEDKLIVKEEFGKEKSYSFIDDDIFITRIKAGPIIVAGPHKYFIYGKKLINFDGLTENLEHLGVLPREDVIKANMTNAERLKDSWGRGKNN